MNHSSNSNGATPQEHSANDEGGKNNNNMSTLPTSILKDDMINRPQNTEGEPTDLRRESVRKSDGRRVSFARTAHVRMYEIPEEKRSNAYVIPDISSQTGTAGFSLGAISAIEETSMTSNDSFDVSVNNSDPSDSMHSTENSFATDGEQRFFKIGRPGHSPMPNRSIGFNWPSPAITSSPSVQAQHHLRYANMLDEDDDDDDDTDDNDGDDDAVTMELTGTVDMGAINNGSPSSRSREGGMEDDEDEDEGIPEEGPTPRADHLTNLTGETASGALTGNSDAESFLNMLLQSNAHTQDTSLLNNILSQFRGDGNNEQETADMEDTRVGIPAAADEDIGRDATLFMPDPHTSSNDNQAVEVGDENEDEEDDSSNYEDAVTMDLTGIVSQPPSASPAPVEQGEPERPPTSVRQRVSTPARPKSVGRHSSIASTPRTPIPAPLPLFSDTPQPGQQQQRMMMTPNNWQGTDTLADLFSVLSSTNPSAAATLSQIVSSVSPRTPSQPQNANNLLHMPSSPLAQALMQRAQATPPQPLFTQGPPSATHYSAAKSAPRARAKRGTPLATRPWHTPTPSMREEGDEENISHGLMSSPKQHAGKRFGLFGQGASPNTSPASKRVKRSKKDHQTDSSSFLASPPHKAAPKPAPAPEPEPEFLLDPLPEISVEHMVPPLSLSSFQHSNNRNGDLLLVDQIKAGLVSSIYDAYKQLTLIPEYDPEGDSIQRGFSMKFAPMYQKAKLSSRLEYCMALSQLFEVDRDVSNYLMTEATDYSETMEFFEQQNELLEQRREELNMRIAKAKKLLAEDAPSDDHGRLSTETKDLKVKLAEIKSRREAKAAETENLNDEINALQATSTSFSRQATDKKGIQSILLAINGLQVTDATEDKCDFVYDKFSKLHLEGTAEFTSLHPDIDWSAVVKDNIDSADTMTMRQYTIAVMKTNAVIRKLLTDVKKVKGQTFVNLQYSNGLQIRVQFFSRQHRRRFHLVIPLESLTNYTDLHQEKTFDHWTTDITYGNIDTSQFTKCLKKCNIDSKNPLYSIYSYIDQSMAAF